MPDAPRDPTPTPRDETAAATVRLRRALEVVVGDRVDAPALELRHAVEEVLSILERADESAGASGAGSGDHG